jgi:iron complex transport system substrate-binding protein
MFLLRRPQISILLLTSFLVFSCGYFNKKSENNKEAGSEKDFDSIILSTKVVNSNGFNLNYSSYYKIITIKNPWQKSSEITYKYLLVNRGNPIPKIKTDEVIEIPVQRVICLSTTHLGYLEKISELKSLVGVSGAQYVYNLSVNERVNNSEIFDVGYDSGINYELIVSLKPDVVFAYSVQGGELAYLNKLRELGIPVVIVGEYLETDPLARAEWILFFAAFFNKEAEAGLIFNEIVEKYKNLKKLADSANPKPNLISGLPYKGNWYIPEGQSYQAVLFKDAGGNYIWKNRNGRESSVIDIETVVMEGNNADFWINPGQANFISDILSFESRLLNFKSLENRRIFNTTERLSEGGGMDYWESGPVNPQLILSDLIYIFHPELLPNHKLHYYKNLDNK